MCVLCCSDKDVGEDYYSYDAIYGDREEKIYDQMMNLRPKPSVAEQPVRLVALSDV